jgi:hypothetical protein
MTTNGGATWEANTINVNMPVAVGVSGPTLRTASVTVAATTPVTYLRRRLRVASMIGPQRNHHAFADRPIVTIDADRATGNPTL